MNNTVIFFGFILMMVGMFMTLYGLELIQFLPSCKEDCERVAEWATRNFYIGLGIGFSSMLIVIGAMFQNKHEQSV